MRKTIAAALAAAGLFSMFGCRDTTYGRAVEAQKEQQANPIETNDSNAAAGRTVRPPISDLGNDTAPAALPGDAMEDTRGAGVGGSGAALNQGVTSPQQLPEDSSVQQPAGLEGAGKPPPYHAAEPVVNESQETSNTGTGAAKTGTLRTGTGGSGKSGEGMKKGDAGTTMHDGGM